MVALTAFLMFFGVQQLGNTAVDVFPEFAPPRVEVQTTSWGLAASEVEALVTVPLEFLGIISHETALANGAHYSFMTIRFLLGLAEAGLFPGFVLYFTYWFPSYHHARIVSGFLIGLPIAVAAGAPRTRAHSSSSRPASSRRRSTRRSSRSPRSSSDPSWSPIRVTSNPSRANASDIG